LHAGENWFCKYESPTKILHNNPYFLLADALFAFLCFLTLMHESLALSVPDLNLSWHAQSVLSFFGMRVPLVCFLRNPSNVWIHRRMCCRMRLPLWAEGPAVGLSSAMLLIPYRILGTKLLWWTWHDTDPTIKDRYVFKGVFTALVDVLDTVELVLLLRGLYVLFCMDHTLVQAIAVRKGIRLE
ncbi:hypothetical protein OSTOST_18171, partial [Ostertagia ostertagi]